MSELPTGTVTFLFTDLEGSTRLWEEHPDAMRDALVDHDSIVRGAIEAHGGVVFSEMGDGMAAAFGSVADALTSVVEAQLGLGSFDWGATGPLRARMALHAAEGELRPDGHYVNQPLNRCARLMAIAHGGQVVVSETVEGLARRDLPPEVGLVGLGEHRLRDLASAIGVFQVTHPGLPRDFPPLRSLDALPGNLPVQVTSFVGREAELARVAGELAEVRVVTLTGVGGVGKTRLALEVAAEVVPEFRGGAWLVELAGVRDAGAVLDALMATFGLRPGAGSSAIETLLEFLRGKELLLVVDNCEHLLRSVAEVVDAVVRGCPNVRVLATSREGLNVAGERILGVASLDVPDDGADLDAITLCDAVTLFVDRARATRPDFALDATNARAVAQVCRRLDGIALAIELAAARVAMLTPRELARRLDDRFRLLAGGRRTAVERHQTLRATIDWSYELLSEIEQVVLARLSIFAGGFSLEAAEAVTAGGAIEADDVFELLATLVARSLVVADTEGVDTRYRLLETIRQYAQEQLDDTSDGERLRAAHAAYYADFAETALPRMSGPDGLEWERRFEWEFDNLRAALAWAVDTQDVDTAMRLFATWDVPILTIYGAALNYTAGAADLVVAIPGASDHPKYPSALVAAAWGGWGQGDLELVGRRCDEVLTAEKRLRTDPSIGVWVVRSQLALAQGYAEQAIEPARQAVTLARARDDPAWLASTLGHLVLANLFAGDEAAARRDVDELVGLARRVANPRLVQFELSIAAFALGDADPERALGLARDALEVTPAREQNLAYAFAGDVAARLGHLQEALRYFARALDAFLWRGGVTAVGTVVERVGSLLAERDPEAAAVLHGAGNGLAPGYAHAPHAAAATLHATATVEAALGTKTRAHLYAQGTAMNADEAVAYAEAAIARALSDRPS